MPRTGKKAAGCDYTTADPGIAICLAASAPGAPVITLESAGAPARESSRGPADCRNCCKLLLLGQRSAFCQPGKSFTRSLSPSSMKSSSKLQPISSSYFVGSLLTMARNI